MFLKYVSIGILNTLLHWIVFFLLFYLLGVGQGLSNLFAFLAAVTFSFFMNARFTFNQNPTSLRYLLFIGFMGILSYFVGSAAEYFDLYPIITLILFSGISLVLGYLYSKLIVFR